VVTEPKSTPILGDGCAPGDCPTPGDCCEMLPLVRLSVERLYIKRITARVINAMDSPRRRTVTDYLLVGVTSFFLGDTISK
jgi:hypothetical protein